MKQSDIISIVLVASVGVVGSAFAVNALLGNPDEAYVTYENIEVIDAALAEPDSEVFNANAINPTVEVYVGDCEDVDQDGTLSQAELVACGRIESLEEADATDEDEDAEDMNVNEEGEATGGEVYVQDEDVDADEEE